MQIQGFTLKLDEASLPWRSTRHPGIAWIPLQDEPASRDPMAALGTIASRDLIASDDPIASNPIASDGARGSAAGPAHERRSHDSTVLIRMDPGCGYPAHRHLDVEEVLVLRGGYRDDRGEHRAGTYLRYPSNSVHSPIALGDRARPIGDDNPACLLFAIARGGVENLE